MRRVNFPSRSKDNERGATAVVTAILMVVLLGFAAISVDVGMMYAERAQLQNGADSAALGIAYNCAKSTGSTGCASPTAPAAELANANANDGLASTDSVTVDTLKRTVTVNVSSMNASKQNKIQLVFANIFGITDTKISTTATATWPAPAAMTTVPWVFGQCALNESLTAKQLTDLANTGNFSADPSGKHIVIRSDNDFYSSCQGSLGYPNGGFAWLQLIDGNCQALINPEPNGATGNPEKSVDHSICTSAFLTTLLAKPMLIPLFSRSSGGGGGTYTIYGFASFQVTGWNFPSIGSQPDPSGTPTCKNHCAGFTGFFNGYVTIDQYLAMQPSTGSTVVRLIK